VVFDGRPRGREPESVGVAAQDGIALAANTATMDDSFRIAELLYGAAPPQPLPLMIGYFEIISSLPVAVDAVYTASDRENRMIAMEVNRIEGKPL
jgi:hypothetical protein